MVLFRNNKRPIGTRNCETWGNVGQFCVRCRANRNFFPNISTARGLKTVHLYQALATSGMINQHFVFLATRNVLLQFGQSTWLNSSNLQQCRKPHTGLCL